MLSSWDAGVVSQAFGVGVREVAVDAVLVSRWRGPLDDLLSELRRRHGFSVAEAYRYLRALRRALRGGYVSF